MSDISSVTLRAEVPFCLSVFTESFTFAVLAFCFGFYLAVLVVWKKSLPGLGTSALFRLSIPRVSSLGTSQVAIVISKYGCTRTSQAHFFSVKYFHLLCVRLYRPGLWTTTRCMLKWKSQNKKLLSKSKRLGEHRKTKRNLCSQGTPVSDVGWIWFYRLYLLNLAMERDF